MITFNDVRALGFISAAGGVQYLLNHVNFAVPLGASIADISEMWTHLFGIAKYLGQRGHEQQAAAQYTSHPNVTP
jgi:hypothetical protein